MDQPVVWVVIGVSIAGVVLAVYILRHKSRVRGGVTGPFGLEAIVEADDKQEGGKIGMEGVTAKQGSVEAVTGLGGNVGMKQVEAGQDVKARTDSVPPKNEWAPAAMAKPPGGTV